MHETFHKDPTDVSKRKPRRLRGTPAFKWSVGLSLGITVSYGLFCHFLTESNFIEGFKRKYVNLVKPTEEEAMQKLIMKDLFYASAITNLEKKRLGKLDPREGEVPQQ